MNYAVAIYVIGFTVTALVTIFDDNGGDGEPVPLIGIFALAIIWPVIVALNIAGLILEWIDTRCR